MTQAEQDAPQAVEQPGLPEESVVSPVEETEDGDSPSQDTEQEDESPASKLERRMHDLSAQKNAERERANQLERELQELRARQAQQDDPQQLQHQAARPKLADYGFDEEAFEQATEAWMQQGYQLQQQQQQRAYEVQQLTLKQHELTIKGREKYEDFESAVNNPALPSLGHAPYAARAVLESEHGADIAYKLAKEPSLAVELIQMRDPFQQARKVWEIEQEFRATPKPRAPKTEPPTRFGGSSAPSQKDPDKMTTEEWLEWRNSTKRTR